MKSALFALSFSFALLSCGERVADPSNGSETTNGFATHVLTQEGQNAAYAQVFVRPLAYYASTDSTQNRSADFTCDSSGKLVLSKIADSSIIEIRSNKNQSLFFLFVPNHSKIADTLTLQASTSIYGSIDRSGLASGSKLFVQVKGLEYLVQVDSNGDFSLRNLPAGKHELRILSDHSEYGMVQDSLLAQQNQFQNAGLFRLPYNAWRDSSIVQQILDSNQVHKTVQEVVERNKEGRIVGLNLDSLGIHWLGNDLFSLRLRHLSLNVNLLDSLPNSLGKMATLEVLTVRKNQISFIPGSLGELEFLRTLDLSRNMLSSLPESIIRLKNLNSLSVSYNALVNIREPLSTWLDSYSTDSLGGNWRLTQRNSP